MASAASAAQRMSRVKQASLFSEPSAATDLAPIEPLRAHRARPLTAAQRRFNTLLKQTDALRTDLEQWQQFTDGHFRRVSSELLPAAQQLRERQSALAQLLDSHYDHPGLGKRNRADVRELLLSLLEQMLEEEETPELIALYERHAPRARAEEERQGFELLRALAEDLPVDLEAYAGAHNAEDFAEWLQESLHEARPRPRRERRAPPAAEDPEQRPEALDSQALRTVFRRLASKLHPDRSSDAAEHERKTALMQELNTAYASGDLLRVLELQQRVDARAADGLAALDDAQLKPYLTTLQRQAQRLRAQIDALIEPLLSIFPGRSARALSPQAVQREFERALAELAQTRARVEHDLELFADIQVLRAVLEESRREAARPRRRRR